MKANYLFLSLFLLSKAMFSQVGITTSAPASTLDITATNPTGVATPTVNDGLLVPRVTRERAQSMTAPNNSTMIYVNEVVTGTLTGTASNIATTGFYYFDTTIAPAPGKWVKITTGANNDWTTTGNSGMIAATNFIGTTDANPLVFRSSNTERMRIVQTTGEVVVGATVPFAGDKFSAYATGAQYGVNGYSTLIGVGVFGQNTGTGFGVEGDSTTTGIGVFGFNNGTGFAIQGNNTSTGIGVAGFSSGTNGALYGQANVANGIGTRGITNGINGSGVLGTASGAGSTGVFGSSSGTGTASGMWGRGTGVTNGTGVLGAGNGLIGSVSTSGSGGAFIGTSFGTVSFGSTVASGIGIAASGNNVPNTTLNGFGAGGAFAANSYGVTSFAAITGVANNAIDRATFFGQYTSAGTTIENVHVGARIAGVHYKILGTGGGSVSTTMPTSQGERIMFAPEATENWFFDMGEVQLINGKAIIVLDPIFLETISDSKPFKVFVQGAENTLGAIRIIRNQKDKTFELQDMGGQSNGVVQFSVYAIWKGKEDIRMPIYDSNLKYQSKKIETINLKEKAVTDNELIPESNKSLKKR
jgi:hypothetical protein